MNDQSNNFDNLNYRMNNSSFDLNLPNDLRERIERHAQKNGRTLNEEISRRLEQSIGPVCQRCGEEIRKPVFMRGARSLAIWKRTKSGGSKRWRRRMRGFAS